MTARPEPLELFGDPLLVYRTAVRWMMDRLSPEEQAAQLRQAEAAAATLKNGGAPAALPHPEPEVGEDDDDWEADDAPEPAPAPAAALAPAPVIASASVASPLRIWTHEALAAHDFGTPEYFVDQILAPGAVTLVFGGREAGKTQFILTMIRAMQEGALFLGRFQARRAKVAVFQFDMPPVGFQARLKRAIAQCTFDPELVRFVTGNGSTVNTMRLSPAYHRIFDEVRKWGPDVIAFDSLRKSHAENENDTGVPSRVYAKWHELFPGAGLVTNHHVGKPPSLFEQRKKGSTMFRAAEEVESYRGTTAWLDDANYGVLVAYNKQQDRRTVQITRGQSLAEEIKRQLISVALNEEHGLFLVPTEMTPVERLKQYRMEHPTNQKAEAVAWIAAEYPGRSDSTYYKWALDAGYPKS